MKKGQRPTKARPRRFCHGSDHAPGCRPGRPLCRGQRAVRPSRRVCLCSAYPFPHRFSSGACGSGGVHGLPGYGVRPKPYWASRMPQGLFFAAYLDPRDDENVLPGEEHPASFPDLVEVCNALDLHALVYTDGSDVPYAIVGDGAWRLASETDLDGLALHRRHVRESSHVPF